MIERIVRALSGTESDAGGDATAGPARWTLWPRIYAFGIALACAVFLYNMHFLPGTLDASPWLIEDDARQFLAWSARIADSTAMPGDMIADYWQSVSPPAYHLLLWLFGLFGLSPREAAAIVPVLLLALSAVLAWKVAHTLTGNAMAAFVMAGLVMISVTAGDTITSATPRAFATPFFLLFLFGLITDRPVRIVAGIVLMAAFYPAPAVASLGILGLSKLRMPPRFFDWSGRALATVAAAAAGLGAMVLPLARSSEAYGPVVTLAQALAMPNMGTPDGRTSIVDAGGNVGWFCSDRIGFSPTFVDCRGPADPAAWLLYLLVFVPPLLLFALYWRARRRGEESALRPTPLYAQALASALVCYTIAALLAFKLHLPSRYSQRILDTTAPMALGHFLGMGAVRLGAGGKRALTAGLMGLFSLAFVVGMPLSLPRIVRPADAGAFAAIKALPATAVLAGVTEELAAVPALTGHEVLASTEHAVPYHLGYFERISARLSADVGASATDDPAALARFIREYRITHFLFDRAFVEQGVFPRSYAQVAPGDVAAAQGALNRRKALVQRYARACAVYAGPRLLLIDAHCVIAHAS